VLVTWVRGGLPAKLGRTLDVGVAAWAGGVGFALLAGAAAIASGLWVPRARPDASAIALALMGAVPLALATRRAASRPRKLLAALGAQALLACFMANVFAAPAIASDAPVLRRFALEVRESIDGEPVEFHRTGSRSIQFLLGRNVAELRLSDLRRLARAPEPSWVILSGSRYAELSADAALFGSLGSPPALLRSRPRVREDGDDLVLIHIGGS
jgi:hypothetical protein